MYDLTNFHRVVATMAPKLNVSVRYESELKTTATGSYIAESYNVSALGDGLPRPVQVTSTQSEADAAYQFSQALNRVRLEYQIEEMLRGLQGEWSPQERHAMRQRLLGANRDYAKVLLADYRKQDKARYDAAMGQAYEESGYYDSPADEA